MATESPAWPVHISLHTAGQKELPAFYNKLQTSSKKQIQSYTVLKHTAVSKPPATAGHMFNKKCLSLCGPLSSKGFLNKPILLSSWVLRRGRLFPVSRSAGGHALPEEKWMTRHPLLFITTYRADVYATPLPDQHLCTLTCTPGMVAFCGELCKLQEKRVQVSSAN